MDRISNLSDDLLLKILSSLHTKYVVATMFLSKRWKFLWTMVPKLDFDDDFERRSDSGSGYDEDDFTRFRQYVDRFMVLHKSPVLESLKFRLGFFSIPDDMATWMRVAIVRCVRELEIYRYSEDEHVSLSRCLYTYENFVVLKLYKSIVLDVPTTVRLLSLKSLHLVSVEYKNEQSHRRLLSGCPVLEELVLDKSGVDLGPCCYVVVPSLQRLSILDTNEYDNESGIKVVISAPSLKYLNIVDNHVYGLLCLSENMPEMVEATVNVVHKIREKLLVSLTSVIRLSLCLSTSVMKHRIEFNQLVHLQLCPCLERWWDLLTWMLESSRKLQVLKLYMCETHRFDEEKPIKSRWGQPSSVPECLLFHLNTFEWNYYNGRREEKKMVAYILSNAKQLKTAKISAWTLGSEEGARKLKELASLHRASKSCQLLSVPSKTY